MSKYLHSASLVEEESDEMGIPEHIGKMNKGEYMQEAGNTYVTKIQKKIWLSEF